MCHVAVKLQIIVASLITIQQPLPIPKSLRTCRPIAGGAVVPVADHRPYIGAACFCSRRPMDTQAGGGACGC